jgi:hypothetical protein
MRRATSARVAIASSRKGESSRIRIGGVEQGETEERRTGTERRNGVAYGSEPFPSALWSLPSPFSPFLPVHSSESDDAVMARAA